MIDKSCLPQNFPAATWLTAAGTFLRQLRRHQMPLLYILDMYPISLHCLSLPHAHITLFLIGNYNPLSFCSCSRPAHTVRFFLSATAFFSHITVLQWTVPLISIKPIPCDVKKRSHTQKKSHRVNRPLGVEVSSIFQCTNHLNALQQFLSKGWFKAGCLYLPLYVIVLRTVLL